MLGILLVSAAFAAPVVGHDGPAVLVATDPQARWVALCQPEAPVDEVEVQAGLHRLHVSPRLELALLAGDVRVPLGRLVARAPDGDHVLAQDEDGVVLVSADGEVRRLGSEPIPRRQDGMPEVGAFSPSGAQVAWVRGEPPRLAVHDIEAGTTRVVDHGPLVLFRVGWLADDWLWIQGSEPGTPPPRVRSSAPTSDCASGGVMSSRVASGGDLYARAVHLEHGPAPGVPIGVVGDQLATWEVAQGVQVGDGQRWQPLRTPLCRGVLTVGDEVGVVCLDEEPWAPVELVSLDGSSRTLDLRLQITAPRAYPVGEGSALWDIDGGLWVLAPGLQRGPLYDRRPLTVTDGVLITRERGGIEVWLPDATAPVARLRGRVERTAWPWVVLGDGATLVLADVSEGADVRSRPLSQAPLALLPDGRMLMADVSERRWKGMVDGPLTWQAPPEPPDEP